MFDYILWEREIFRRKSITWDFIGEERLEGFAYLSIKGEEMDNKAYVRPSKAVSVFMVIICTLFLVFGIVFVGTTAEGEASPYALMFMVLWIVVCGGMIVYSLSIIFSKSPPAVEEVEIPTLRVAPAPTEPGGDPENKGRVTEMDFETKLRKLESLRREGLISEKEYKQKRSEIMGEKW